MSETSRTLETTFIVNASLDDAQIDAVIGKVQELITKNGGEVKSVQRIGRKRLAYTIQKKNNGFYVTVEFVGSSDLVPKLDRHFHLEENVLRYLTVHLTTQMLSARQALSEAAQSALPQSMPETQTPEAATTEDKPRSETQEKST